MANSLLDFVMSLVRDPAAAAHYAADPAQAIADANLTDVTSADVNHLIPVVAESMSSTVPALGADSFAGDSGHNVWTSGAATAAFDAFDDHLPQQVETDPGGVITELAAPDHGALATTAPALDVPTLTGVDDPGTAVHEPVLDDVPVTDVAADSDWLNHAIDDHHIGSISPDHPGIDDLI
jgi:hypothetical protein